MLHQPISTSIPFTIIFVMGTNNVLNHNHIRRVHSCVCSTKPKVELPLVVYKQSAYYSNASRRHTMSQWLIKVSIVLGLVWAISLYKMFTSPPNSINEVKWLCLALACPCVAVLGLLSELAQ